VDLALIAHDADALDLELGVEEFDVEFAHAGFREQLETALGFAGGKQVRGGVGVEAEPAVVVAFPRREVVDGDWSSVSPAQP
jgi:hypothetical protein